MIPLHISSLKKSYGSRQVVDIDQLELVPGELLALLGPSGCGKSTTLRLIAGLERPSAGDISIADRVVSSERVNVPPQQRNVGLVFQDYALFPHLNVARNVAYGLPRGSGRAARVADMLSLVGLADSGEKYPRELSGGQQQRVALARALAPQPDLLLLDEPFSSLDPGLRQHLRADVRAILQQAGTTALLVTHDQEEALSVADRVAVMLNGRIVQVSAPEQLYYAPVTPEVALFIGDANLMEGAANADGVSTPLGLLHRPTHHRGPVQVMLRPELIGLSPEPVADAAEGVVEGIDFFGHDYVAKVTIGGLEEPIQVRLLRFVILKPGQKVWLTLSGAGMVYPPAALSLRADSPVVG